MASVLQPWVQELTFMQQSVLIASVRGPDGIRKDHVAKLLLRWLRRCILMSAFEGKVLTNPYEGGGGSFTGPSCAPIDETQWHPTDCVTYWHNVMNDRVKEYLSCVDELPHHFQLHFMHAAEILGYKHPDLLIRGWWCTTYLSLVNDMHLLPEPDCVMNKRLGDYEADWRAAEEVTAKGPQ